MGPWLPEFWLPVLDFPNYEVSTRGRVKSLARFHVAEKILKPFPSGKNKRYLYVSLYRDGKRYSAPVHRLVALAFLGEPGEGQEVCHGPAGGRVNSVDNLRWDTRSANSFDALRAGTHVVFVRGRN